MTQQKFERFGERRTFAIEVHLEPDPDGNSLAPTNAVGSWGAWRLWVANTNLCEAIIESPSGSINVDSVRWYLAPLIRWLIENWGPLLHESRIPNGAPTLESRPVDARTLYLFQLKQQGDEESFRSWQDWASRHSLRFCSEGAIVPDLFLQRWEDQLEFSWGERTQLGAEQAYFTLDDGRARASVAAVSSALDSAINWFVSLQSLQDFAWHHELRAIESSRVRNQKESWLSWFLDGSKSDGPISRQLKSSWSGWRNWIASTAPPYALANLSPEVAMFGSLSPEITSEAGARLLLCIETSREFGRRSVPADDMDQPTPAWASKIPWGDGYDLARQVLEEWEEDKSAPATDISGIMEKLGVETKSTKLGVAGPRGVAIAGQDYKPTVVINTDHSNNLTDPGMRFTLAHELCHILFDRSAARSIFHSSGRWAHPAVEQRANAFAAMLLVPHYRILDLIDRSSVSKLESSVKQAARRLKVGYIALVRHLANLGEISDQESETLITHNPG